MGYLVFALVLEAGLRGIEEKLMPCDPVNQNVYQMSKAQREVCGVTDLPSDLMKAVELMEADPMVADVLGDHICDKYLAAKKSEWHEYCMRVSQWELEEYLSKY